MMTRAEPMAHWLAEPTVHTESWALFWTIVAVLVPTLYREAAGPMMGCETIPYVPSVLLSAVFLGWRYAAIIALFSALVADWLFLGPDHTLIEACDLFGVGTFLFTSSLIIASIELPRQVPKKTMCSAPPRTPAG